MTVYPFYSLDLASQETYSDSVSAFKSLCFPQSWTTKQSIYKVKSFLANAVYTNTNKTDFGVSLFFAGRSALRFLLQSLDLPQNSKVIVQGFTCEAVVLPIIQSGLKPVYIDINRDDYSMDIEDLRQKLTPDSKVLILQHSFGIIPKNRLEIIKLCVDAKIWLIEDLAHGFIPAQIPMPCDTYQYCALISFGRSKLISSVFGSATVCADPQLSTKLGEIEAKLPQAPVATIIRCLMYKIWMPLIKSTYQYGFGKGLHKLASIFNLFSKEISAKERGGEYDNQYEYAYPEALASTLVNQITNLPKVLNQIKIVGEMYRELASSPPLPYTPLNRYPIQIPNGNRDNILRHFSKFNIRLGSWYTQPVGPGSVSLAKMLYQNGMCPVAEEICQNIINLPTNVSLDMAKFIKNELKRL